MTFLIPIALLLAAFFIGGFIWMTKKGQYDDLETPGLRMLFEDKENKNKDHYRKNNQTQEEEE